MIMDGALLLSNAHPRANITVVVYDALTEAILSEQRFHNLVVLTGRNMIRDAIWGDSPIPYPIRFALGTGTAAVTAADLTLGNEVWRDGFTTKSKSSAQIEIKYFLTSTTANGNTLTEAGLFSAPSGGTMYARAVFNDPIIKTSSIAVLFVWTLTFGAG